MNPEQINVDAPLLGVRGMLFAAGLGTRLKPFTDRHPKALAPVNGKPLLQRNIEYFKSHGIREIVVNTHHFADQIEDFLNRNGNFGCRISISRERDEPLETGGGLLHAAPYLADSPLPFLVMNADILTDLDLGAIYRHHLERRPLVTLAVTRRKSSRNLLFDEDMVLSGWANQSSGETRIVHNRSGKTLQPFAFTCVHVVEPAIFPLIRQTGKFSIIDTYLDLAAEYRIEGYLHEHDCVVDVGRPESILEAERHFR
jgi:MurNAc alpha-1-phosphate uridylyltransferase